MDLNGMKIWGYNGLLGEVYYEFVLKWKNNKKERKKRKDLIASKHI